ncbi:MULTISPECIES: serine hydrolase domain-containing protein [unclassified Rhodococcus (in: high G+C Gram-positive bacteria)]|uniref:serine hydrolase domain-containing protein n=1 Tax=unclassified Rhodococcus (in: high G+C Gram-positive bacteria) TaxID=192944 RepID=UPI00163B235C|nr:MULTISPECIES: serine hydrolase domain-containing protein [unclassified Rhodococcus (in: high G+C Gram-positive bacteria)]MBC2642463.1 beta-lactamase family protein [Rhodococcus sp. 3A]MBC2892795.1 beta-lactamase family protein [Rhodococcus sp. 4CII]
MSTSVRVPRPPSVPRTELHVDPRFLPLADQFFAMYRQPQHGGGALTVYLRGEKVLDIWAGWADRDRRWDRDTMALSFSTGKGVASTVVHRLAERRLIDYDAPIARYWPEFGAAGKDDITVRELLTHRAGLHKVRGLMRSPLDLLDYDAVVQALAATPADPRRLRGPGYHAVTYGWLVAELIARVTGKPFVQVVQDEIAGPLGVDDFWYQVPGRHRPRIAKLFPHINPAGLNWELTSNVLSLVGPTRGLAEAAMPQGFDVLVRNPAVHDAVMPGWNGVFSARALARMYGAIANGGRLDGRRFLRTSTIAQMSQVQTHDRDYVLGIRPRWSLGYHRPIFMTREQPANAIGHYGVGGSGAYADLESGLALGFVTNRLGSSFTALGDLRLARLGVEAQSIVRNDK